MAALRERHTIAVLLVVAFALRCWDFGNPVVHVDEQYYLLVGDRLVHGAVPYVDIWDRKPVGLFLLYAAIRLLPGDGIVAYQFVAALFAAATAAVVRSAGLRLGASGRGALTAGIAYLVWISLLGGRGGQAPVFYNLPIAIMARLAIGLPATLRKRHASFALLRDGTIACLFGGIAIQLKYTAAIEAGFYGAVFGWFLLKTRPKAIPALATLARWLALGLAPTLATMAWYGAHGSFDRFWFANITSITLRPGYPPTELAMRLLGIVAILSPLMAAAAMSWRWRADEQIDRLTLAIALGGVAAALVGFLAIGTFFDHYALPLVTPLCILAAPALDRSRGVPIGLLAIGVILFAIERTRLPDDAAGARRIARIVAANDRGQCPYVFIGDTVTYLLAKACLPTAYAFPNFLAYTTEQGATGIDEAGEVRRILSRRPPVIIGSTRPLAIWNRRSLAVLRPVLARDYRIVVTEPRAGYRTVIWLRRDLPLRD